MKKMLIYLSLFCMSFGTIHNTSALEPKDYIIAGDGTFENPYILKDENNEIAKFINKNFDEKMYNANQGITRSAQIFTGCMNVDKGKTIADPGSYWKKTSGGQNTTVNGNMVFSLIDYTNWSQMGDMCAHALKGDVKSALKSIAASSTSSATAKSKLVNLGVKASTVISGFLPAIGFAAGVYGGISTYTSYSTALSGNTLADAQLNKHYVMTVHYKTAYQGSWYAHSRVEEGTTRSNPQIPHSRYGIGTFVAKTRLN